MRIDVLPEARDDLLEGFEFYEGQESGLGKYFRDCLDADIETLADIGGVHAKVFNYHRSLSRRFPFAIYYRLEENVVRVRAILDCRRNPSWIRRKLGARRSEET